MLVAIDHTCVIPALDSVNCASRGNKSKMAQHFHGKMPCFESDGGTRLISSWRCSSETWTGGKRCDKNFHDILEHQSSHAAEPG